MSPQLDITPHGALGIIALNRPEAINALSREMIDGIAAQLSAWRDDATIRAVLFEGRGARGFCSGGDVRAVRALVLGGQLDEADAYFTAEYKMNELISTYPKPVVALGHGVIMGGGIGIFGHARYRFTLPEARFAMPEAAIGFVCDVGVNAIVAQTEAARALAFLMSGIAVGPADAIALGLCDAMIEAGRRDEVRTAIVAAAATHDPDSTLVRLMSAESCEPGEAQFCAEAAALAAAFAAPTAGEIVAAVTVRAATDARFQTLATVFASRSPSSLEAILQSYRAARQRSAIGAVLALDRRLAHYVSRQADFAEGVRAVLVDKDQAPKWVPNTFAGVDSAAIAQVIATVGNS